MGKFDDLARIFRNDLLAYLQANYPSFAWDNQSILPLDIANKKIKPVRFALVDTAPAGDNWGINPRTTHKIRTVMDGSAFVTGTTTESMDWPEQMFDINATFVTDGVRPFQFVLLDDDSEARVLSVLDENTLVLDENYFADESGVNYRIFDYMTEKDYTQPEYFFLLISVFSVDLSRANDLKDTIADFLNLWDDEKLIVVGDTTTESLATLGFNIIDNGRWMDATFEEDKVGWIYRWNCVVTLFSNKLLTKSVAPISQSDMSSTEDIQLEDILDPQNIDEVDMAIFNEFMSKL